MKREPTASLLPGNVDYLDEIDTYLMIEADVTINKKQKSEIWKMFLCFYWILLRLLFMINWYENIWRNVNMQNLAVNERNGAVRLKRL